MAYKYLFSNNARVELVEGVSSVDELLTVGDESAILTFASGDTFGIDENGFDRIQQATIVNPGIAGAYEIVSIKALNILDGTFTVERGREGTTARDWPSGSTLEARITAEMLKSMANTASAASAAQSPIAPDPIPTEVMTPSRPSRLGRVVTGRSHVMTFGNPPLWGSSHMKGDVVKLSGLSASVRFVFLDDWAGTPPTPFTTAPEMDGKVKLFTVQGSSGRVRVLAYGVKMYGDLNEIIRISLSERVIISEIGVVLTKASPFTQSLELSFTTRMISVGPMLLSQSGYVGNDNVFRVNPNPPGSTKMSQDGATDYIDIEVNRDALINTPLNGYIYWTGFAVGDDEIVDYSTAGPFTEVP